MDILLMLVILGFSTFNLVMEIKLNSYLKSVDMLNRQIPLNKVREVYRYIDSLEKNTSEQNRDTDTGEIK